MPERTASSSALLPALDCQKRKEIWLKKLAPRAGLEPATQRLTDNPDAIFCETVRPGATARSRKSVDYSSQIRAVTCRE
jgi:hypothetical protein